MEFNLALIKFLEGILPRCEYFTLLLIFFIFITALLLSRDSFKEIWKSLSKGSRFLIPLILVLSLLLRFYAPLPFATVHDEFLYLEGSLVAANHLKLASCEQPLSGTGCVIHKPYLTYPFLTSLAFLFLPPSYMAGVGVNILFSVLTSLVLFLLTYLLFKSEIAAVSASLLSALIPIPIIFSKTAETASVAAFFTLLTFLTLELYLRRENKQHLTLFLATLALAIYSIINNIVLIPLLLIYVYFHKRSALARIKKRCNLPYLFSFLLLILPQILHILVIVLKISEPQLHPLHGSYSAEAGVISLTTLGNNIRPLISMAVGYGPVPLLFSLISLGGLLLLFKNQKRFTKGYTAFWFAYLFLIITYGVLNYNMYVEPFTMSLDYLKGIISHFLAQEAHYFVGFGNSPRYLTLNLLLLTPIVGYFLAVFPRYLGGQLKENKRTGLLVSLMLTAILVLSFYPYLKPIYNRSENQITFSYQSEKLLGEEVPDNCLITSHARATTRFMYPERYIDPEKLLRQRGIVRDECIYYISTPRARRVERDRIERGGRETIPQQFELETVRVINQEDNPNYQFGSNSTLYKLEGLLVD